jgi:hypothetical protein
MLSLQPVFLSQYLNFFHSSWQLNQGIKTLFYLSWEDALWDVLRHKNIPNKSVILVPDFFCDDVENNMRAHGLSVAHYPVNADLQTTQSQILHAIQRNQPSIIVVFHAVGISSHLLEQREWIKTLSANSILIEDCVHRIIDPSQVRFYKKNHLMITSLRKVSPLQGSVLFGRSEDILFEESNSLSSWWYSIKVTVLWFLMNINARLAHTFYFYSKLAKLFSLQAEQCMLIGYDLIGDNLAPAKGLPLFYWLYTHFNFDSIKITKIYQAQLYEKLFFGQPLIYKPSDRKELRGWPLILSLDVAKSFLEKVRNEGLYLRFELNNSEWSKKQKIVYLPIGPHISTEQQKTVAALVKKYL